MKKAMRNKLVMATLALSVLSLGFGALSFNSASATEQKPTPTTFEMEGGASVRTEVPSGIRFTTWVNTGWMQAISDENAYFGTIIAPTTEYKGAETDFKHPTDASYTVQDIKHTNKANWKTDGEYTILRAVLTEIPEEYYGTEIIARSYLHADLTNDGEANPTYTYAEEAQSRSIAEVAYKAVQDKKDAEFLKTILTETMAVKLSATELELNVNEAKTVTAEIEYPFSAKLQETENLLNWSTTWTSSDEAVATVKDGKIVGVNEGMATITVKIGEKESTVAVNVSRAWNVIEDFASESAKAAIATVGAGTIDRNTTNSTAQYHTEVKDITGASRYGVVSAKPVADGLADGTKRNYRGSDHNIYIINSQIYKGNVEGIKNMAAGGKPSSGTWSSSSNKETYRERWFLNQEWDYLSVWIYVEDETPNSTLTEIEMMARYGQAKQNVPMKTWYEFKIDKHILFGRYDKDIGNIFSGNYSLIEFAYGSNPSAELLKLTQNCRVYFDSISLEKYDNEQAFTKVSVIDVETGAEVTALESNKTYKVQLFVGETVINSANITAENGGKIKNKTWTAVEDGFTFVYEGTSAGYDNGVYASFAYTDTSTGITYRARLLMKMA